MTRKIILNTTTTCPSCGAVERRMKAEGLVPGEDFEKVVLDLPENAERLAELKRVMKSDIINVPLIEYGTDRRQIDGLRDVITKYKEDH